MCVTFLKVIVVAVVGVDVSLQYCQQHLCGT